MEGVAHLSAEGDHSDLFLNFSTKTLTDEALALLYTVLEHSTDADSAGSVHQGGSECKAVTTSVDRAQTGGLGTCGTDVAGDAGDVFGMEDVAGGPTEVHSRTHVTLPFGRNGELSRTFQWK